MHKLKNKNKNNMNMIIDHENNNCSSNNNNNNNNPSFSSTLLDQIYRSIDQGDTRSPEMRFYRETTTTKKKQSSSNKQKTETRTTTTTKTTTSDNNYKGISENAVLAGKEKSCHRRRSSRDEHVDQDAMFFSSASFSSDSCSSSGGFSSSDTESLYGTRSRSSYSCFAPLRPKPVTSSMSLSFRSEEQGSRRFNSFRHDSNLIGDELNETSLIKSKSRALKIYNNLKKVKQPISPGGKITGFINSIFANSKKTKGTHEDTAITATTTISESKDVAVAHKLAQLSTTCSSASSFSRSCLSKTNSSERERLDNRVRRTVRFYPVNMVVSEDHRKPNNHKSVCELEDDKKFSFLRTKAQKNGITGEAVREFLDEYRSKDNKKSNKNELVLKDLNLPVSNEDDYDDDVASCASSDLFELDHLAVFGNGRYSEELPVYETTHVATNHAIANGFMV